jgi:hypothetical protein
VATDSRSLTRPYFRAKSTGFSPAGGVNAPQWPATLASLLVFFAISLILSAREIYVAIDDLNYVAYFSNSALFYERLELGDADWWQLFIDEPLWNVYTTTMGATFGPETSFRITIFVGVFLYLLYATRLASGSWVTTTFFFVLHPSIGAQLYFNQIRQGVAFSVFLMLAAVLKQRPSIRMALASGVAALVHSSFIMILSLVALYIVNQRIRIIISVSCVITIVAASQYVDLLSMLSIGRREGQYASGATVNANFYITMLTTYGLIFYILWPGANPSDASEWYFLSFIIAAVAICATSVFDGGGRLTCISDTAICILVARNIRSRNGIMAFWVMVCTILISIISNYRHDSAAQANSIEKWQLILFGTN